MFVRIDRIRKPLEAPYQGPFKLLSINNQTACLQLPNDKSLVVSVERLKPAKIKACVNSNVSTKFETDKTTVVGDHPKKHSKHVRFAI